VRNTRELIALARARPGQLDMGTAGSVLPVHLFNMLAKTNIQVVPYKGAGPLMTDAMGGHVPLAIAAISSVQGAVRSGRVRILAVCSTTGSVLFPDAPLIGKDLPGYNVNAWFGLMAPKGVSQDFVRRVRDDVAAVIQMPDVRQRLLDIGGEPSGMPPEEFSARVRSEIGMWKKVAAEVGLKPE
jgi:tripartite-type tricarboxylate transporter receptor subunit TctC